MNSILINWNFLPLSNYNDRYHLRFLLTVERTWLFLVPGARQVGARVLRVRHAFSREPTLGAAGADRRAKDSDPEETCPPICPACVGKHVSVRPGAMGHSKTNQGNRPGAIWGSFCLRALGRRESVRCQVGRAPWRQTLERLGYGVLLHQVWYFALLLKFPIHDSSGVIICFFADVISSCLLLA